MGDYWLLNIKLICLSIQVSKLVGNQVCLMLLTEMGFCSTICQAFEVSTLTLGAPKNSTRHHEGRTGCARRRWPAPHISPRAVWLARRVHGKLPRSRRTCCPTSCSHDNLSVHCLGSQKKRRMDGGQSIFFKNGKAGRIVNS